MSRRWVFLSAVVLAAPLARAAEPSRSGTDSDADGDQVFSTDEAKGAEGMQSSSGQQANTPGCRGRRIVAARR